MFPSAGQLVSFVLVGLVLQVSSLNLDDPCTNPYGQAGRCINFRECQPIVSIWNKPVVSPEESQFVQASQCGRGSTGALVCCAGLPSTTSRSSSGSKVSLLKPPNCGVDLSDRIVGGQRTALDQYPWTALIHYSKPNGRTGYHCGGSLINSRYVLTAAHCIQAIPRTWNVIGVRLGEWDLDSPIDQLDDEVADAPVDLEVEKIVVHENYQPTNKAQYDDIALIRFNRDVSFSNFIKPICLPVDAQYRNRNNVATKGVAVGWGRTENNAASNVKLVVSLEFKDFRSCANVYKPAGITLRDTQLCAGGVRGQDTCSGDSGGPLSKIEKANHFLYGIVSFGPNKCGTAGVPGVYTNVAKYIEWIESNLE